MFVTEMKNEKLGNIRGWNSIVLFTILLVLLVGPNFVLLPMFWLSIYDLETSTFFVLVGFVVSFTIIFLLLRIWVNSNNCSLKDFGWKKETSYIAVLLGLLVGVFWGLFMMAGYLEVDENANFMEINFIRIAVALMAAGGAPLEDIITRGFVMNELKEKGKSNLFQAVVSSVIFALYHSIWLLIFLDVGATIGAIISFIFSFVYGLILSFLFIKGKRSLIPVILAHSLALLIAEPFATMSMLANFQLT